MADDLDKAVNVLRMITAPVVGAGMLMGGGGLAYKHMAVSGADKAVYDRCVSQLDQSVNKQGAATLSIMRDGAAASVTVTQDGTVNIVHCTAAEMQTTRDVADTREKGGKFALAGLFIMLAGGLIMSNEAYIYAFRASYKKPEDDKDKGPTPPKAPKP